jgi:hypothetical protein
MGFEEEFEANDAHFSAPHLNVTLDAGLDSVGASPDFHCSAGDERTSSQAELLSHRVAAPREQRRGRDGRKSGAGASLPPRTLISGASPVRNFPCRLSLSAYSHLCVCSISVVWVITA